MLMIFTIYAKDFTISYLCYGLYYSLFMLRTPLFTIYAKDFTVYVKDRQ